MPELIYTKEIRFESPDIKEERDFLPSALTWVWATGISGIFSRKM